MTVLRESLRQVPLAMLQSSSATKVLLQPVSQGVGWPSLTLPSGVSVRSDNVGVKGLRGEWLLPDDHVEDPLKAERLLLWAHGGGFAFCSPGTHRRFLAKIALQANMPVFCIEYRKPPEFPFPRPGRDVLAAFWALQRRHATKKVYIGGDSAGGNLALEAALALAQREEQERSPRGIVLLSPWVDLSDSTSESWNSFGSIDYIPVRQTSTVASLYAAGRPLTDVRISPGLRQSWPAKLPPVLLDYGGCEVFRSQIEKLMVSMVKAGVDLDPLMAEEMIHVYPLWDFLWNNNPGPFQGYFERVARFLRA